MRYHCRYLRRADIFCKHVGTDKTWDISMVRLLSRKLRICSFHSMGDARDVVFGFSHLIFSRFGSSTFLGVLDVPSQAKGIYTRI